MLRPRNTVKIFWPHTRGRFFSRPNRFVLNVEMDDGDILPVHSPNPGRMLELYRPGARMLLQKSDNPNRKLAYSAVAIEYGNAWVPLVSVSANTIAAELAVPLLFPEATEISREVSYGKDRFDISLSIEGTHMPIEVKSCSLVEQALGMFPDAPSSRAIKHLKALGDYVEEGGRAAAMFVISHGSPDFFSPNYHNDPDFACELAAARNRGVEIKVVSGSCSEDGIFTMNRSEVQLLLPQNAEQLYACDRGWLLEISPINMREGKWCMNLVKSTGKMSAAERRLGPAARKSGGAVIPFRSNSSYNLVEKFRSAFRDNSSVESALAQDTSLQITIAGNPLHNKEINKQIFALRHRMSISDLQSL